MNQKRSSTSYRKLVIPQVGVEDSALLAYRDDAFGDRNTLRCRRLENAARNLLYVYAKQWVTLDRATLVQGARGYHFRDKPQEEGKEQPRPVNNFISGAVNVEMAALGRGKLTASVRPTNRDPRVQAAAKIAQDILQHRLKDLNWSDKRAQFTFLDIVCGLGILKSYWDESFEQVGFYHNDQAAQCLTCGFSTAKAEGPECPYCAEQGAQQPLFPIDDMTEDQAKTTDSFGIPLGIPKPKGQTMIEVVSPFDFYPENSGIDQDWNSMRVWRQATPRPIEWVLARYPELEGKLEPGDPRDLMKNHPVLGEWDILGRFDASMDADVFANYVMVYETYSEKSLDHPNGRAIVIADEHVALDGELYRTVGPQSVKLVCYSGCNWEQKHRDIWGKALPDDLISPQNVYNGLLSLELESIARTGSPNVVAPRTANTNGPELFEAYDNVGKVIWYDVDPLNPQAKPEVLGGVTTPPSVNNIKQQALEAMQLIQGPSALDRGEAPKNITTTSGLQFLDEQSDKRRGYRLDAIIRAYEKIWSHQLDLLWTLRVDTDYYQAASEDGTWELHQYDKQALMGQTKVEIDHQTEVDKSLYEREAVREAHADGLYTGTGPSLGLSPLARQKLLELRGLPTDVVENDNHQIEMVKQRWVDFIDSGSLPVIDPTTDNFSIQYEGLREYLTSEEGRRISKSMGWEQVLKQIAGWEMRLAQAELMDQQARQLYGTDNPQQAQPMYAQLQAQFQAQTQQYQAVQAQAGKVIQETGMDPQGGMAPPPPQPPVPPVFLQGDKADHIYGVWAQMILEKGGLPQVSPVKGPAGQPDLAGTLQKQDTYLKFRAVVDAYRLLSQAAVPAMPPGEGAPQNPQLAGGQPQLAALNIQPK